ncbi:MAG TPA: hypothetical protein VJZ91_09855 [Blastocatellia bacterium]|nr:hypothetical protein [Blastocatellia bacterium]
MKQLRLLIGASFRSQLRWAGEHLYYWLVLGPVVVGFTTFTVARVVDNLSDWQPAPSTIIIAAIAFEIMLVALSLSRAAAEVYHLRRPEAYFDALPVGNPAHLRAAMAARAGRTMVVAIAALVAHWMAGAGWINVTSWPPLALFVVVTSLAEIYAALNWIHWSHTRQKATAALALLLLFPAIVTSGLLLALVVRDGLLSASTRLWLMGVAALIGAALYLIISRQHDRWRAADMEYARRLQSANRLRLVSAASLRLRLSYAVAAQLARDLQLTLRAFSSAVYVVTGIAALWLVGLAAALTTDLLPQRAVSGGWLDLTWTPQALAIKSACALMVATMAALMPLLVAYELPMMWVERAAAASGLDVCAAKLWYARAVSLIAPLAAWLVGLITAQVPAVYLLPLLGECLLLWWMMSSLTGWLAFEMPSRPGLALIVMTTASLGASALAVIFWPAAFVIHVQATHSLKERGRHMARLYLMTEGD